MADTITIKGEEEFEETEIILEEEGGEEDVVVVDEEGAGTAPAEKDDEAEQYSNRVQKRIGNLTAKMREMERQRDEALNFAKAALKEKRDSQSQSVETMLANLTHQEDAAKAAMNAANAVGDTDKVTEAQADLITITTRKSQLESYKAQMEAQGGEEPQLPQAQKEEPAPAAAAPDPRAEKWAQENPWFGQDKEKTIMALKVHKELVEEGVDPNSEEYYDALDSALKPQKDSGKRTTPVQDVTPSTRTSPSGKRTRGRRTVRLTPSQLAIAKELGVTPAQYAAQIKD